MEILIILLILCVILGLISIFFFFLDGLPLVEPLEKLEYIAQMGVILAPCVVMSSDEFGKPYSLQTWGITIGLMLGCLILTLLISAFIDCIEERADRRQIKKQKKNKQKAVKNLLGRNAVKKFKGKAFLEKVEDEHINAKPKEKRKIRETFAHHLAKAQGSTFIAAVMAPIIIVLNSGIDKLFDPLCILSVILGIGLSLLCGWISRKILSGICN